MAPPVPVKMAESNLISKGFRRSNKKHRKFHYYYDGKDAGIRTMTSHGGDEIDDYLVSCMRIQLKLDSNSQVRDLLNCPMSGQQYATILEAKGFL